MGRIQRRRFLLSAGALLAMPRRASAQQSATIWRIGYITAGGHSASYLDELRKGMRDLGYEAGKNYVIESQAADGKYERLPALAADLVKRNVDVIVGIGTPAIDATKRATSSIPIVMALVGDPVASGFVASLARPGATSPGCPSLRPTPRRSGLSWRGLSRQGPGSVFLPTPISQRLSGMSRTSRTRHKSWGSSSRSSMLRQRTISRARSLHWRGNALPP